MPGCSARAMISTSGAIRRAVRVRKTFSASVGQDADQGLGPLQAGLAERIFLGRVGVDVGDILCRSISMTRSIDRSIDDERHLGGVQLVADEHADPPEAGDDRVADHRFDLSPHPLPPQVVADLAFGQELDEPAQGVGHRHQAQGDHHHRVDSEPVEPIGRTSPNPTPEIVITTMNKASKKVHP